MLGARVLHAHMTGAWPVLVAGGVLYSSAMPPDMPAQRVALQASTSHPSPAQVTPHPTPHSPAMPPDTYCQPSASHSRSASICASQKCLSPHCQGSIRFLTMKDAATTRMRLWHQPAKGVVAHVQAQCQSSARVMRAGQGGMYGVLHNEHRVPWVLLTCGGQLAHGRIHQWVACLALAPCLHD